MDELTVAPGVRRLTVNLDDEDVDLFQGVWPVPNGVALHAYLVEGAQRVLVDPWNDGGYGPEEIEADLQNFGLGWKDIDAVAFTSPYEPALVESLRSRHPRLEDWGLPGSNGHRPLLRTVAGFWCSGSLLFTGHVFAGLGWMEDEVWAEDLDEAGARYFDDEALRWYASRPQAPDLPPGLSAAPAHGCLWRSAAAALERARRFDAWGRAGLDEVAVLWPAGVGADALVEGVLQAGAGLNLLLPEDPLSTLRAAARRSALVVLPAGFDAAFLEGLEKEIWTPSPLTPPDALREGVARKWKEN